jgi:hypothetical protein
MNNKDKEDKMSPEMLEDLEACLNGKKPPHGNQFVKFPLDGVSPISEKEWDEFVKKNQS